MLNINFNFLTLKGLNLAEAASFEALCIQIP